MAMTSMSKRERILQAVLDYLTVHEEGKLTLSNLAVRLDIGKSTIYEYFPNKETLIRESLKLLIQKNAEALLEGERHFETQSFETAFTSHIRRFMEIAEKGQLLHEFSHHPEIATLPREDKRAIYKEMRESMEKTEKRFEAILDKGISEGVLAPLSEQTRLWTIKSLMLGSIIAVSDDDNDWDKEALIKDVLEAVKILHR